MANRVTLSSINQRLCRYGYYLSRFGNKLYFTPAHHNAPNCLYNQNIDTKLVSSKTEDEWEQLLIERIQESRSKGYLI